MLTAFLILASVFAATLPMLTFVSLAWLLDRYDREPVWLIGLIFLWGAVVATGCSLVGNSLFDVVVTLLLGGELAAILGPVISAPLFEELSKGFVLLLVLRSRHLDNTTDGFVYGAASGLGFAMTENFLYFTTIAQGSGFDPLGSLLVWLNTVVARTLYSGLLHATASACLGAGLAAGKFAALPARIGLGSLGLCIAFGMHALWNGLLTAGSLHANGSMLVLADFILFPIQFLTVFAIFQLCLWSEKKRIRTELSAEAREHGTLPAEHAELLSSYLQRRSQRFTPASTNQDAYIRAATTLAFRRHQARMTMGRPLGEWYASDLERLRREIRGMLKD